MSDKIDQLRIHFNGLNIPQKKEFIGKLQQKLRGQSNAEYSRFLNECVNRYNMEMQRNAPSFSMDADDLFSVGGGGDGNTGAFAFERRIEEYKANGYKLLKRSGNTVEMLKPPKGCFWTVSYIGLFIFAIASTVFIGGIYERLLTFALLCFLVLCLGLHVRLANKVTISLTTTNQIEETGKVLENK